MSEGVYLLIKNLTVKTLMVGYIAEFKGDLIEQNFIISYTGRVAPRVPENRETALNDQVGTSKEALD